LVGGNSQTERWKSAHPESPFSLRTGVRTSCLRTLLRNSLILFRARTRAYFSENMTLLRSNAGDSATTAAKVVGV